MKLSQLKCAFGVASSKLLGFIINEKGINDNPENIKVSLEMRSSQK